MHRRAIGEHARRSMVAGRCDHRGRGQALTEFALARPVMLLLLLAVDFGRLFFSYIAVNNAAREATYYAAAHAADSDFDQDDISVAVAEAAEERTPRARAAKAA